MTNLRFRCLIGFLLFAVVTGSLIHFARSRQLARNRTDGTLNQNTRGPVERNLGSTTQVPSIAPNALITPIQNALARQSQSAQTSPNAYVPPNDWKDVGSGSPNAAL